MPVSKMVGQRLDWLLALALLVVNGLVLFNAVFHAPYVGYDAGAHIDYARILSKGRLPTVEESYEHFSPPLSYLLPALFRAAEARVTGAPGDVSDFRLAKFWQLVNVAWSVCLCLLLLKTCQLIRPGDRQFKLLALLLLGMLPVYYKSWAQPRGEPVVALLSMATVYVGLRLLRSRPHRLRDGLILGCAAGLALLARQWSVFVIIAVALHALLHLAVDRDGRRSLTRALILAAVVTFAVGGWFYVHLHNVYGGIIDYYQGPERRFSLFNQPPDFYMDLHLRDLFSKPFRPAFDNRLWPILYSDTWGDYWGYFVVAGARKASAVKWDPVWGRSLIGLEDREPSPLIWTNKATVLPYLGRVNLASTLPSLLLVLGLVMGTRHLGRFAAGRDRSPGASARALLSLGVGISAAGFFWYVVTYPSPPIGGTVKGTYLLHAFPFLAILAADMLQELRKRAPRIISAAIALLAMIALHNAGACVSRYSWLFLGGGEG